MIIGSEIHYLLNTGSTMDDCRTLAKSGAPEGTIVSADQQGSGRGRFERSWISPSGENILMSVLVYPEISHLTYLNMVASLAVSDTAFEITGLSASIKWPNDVQISNKKLCGILIESEISGSSVEYAVIGIGLNVNLDPLKNSEIKDTATSLSHETSKFVSRSQTFKSLIGNLDKYYEQVKNGQSLTSEWSNRVNTIGETINLSFPGTRRKSIKGVAESVKEDGSLLVRQDDDTIFTAVAGEVTLRG